MLAQEQIRRQASTIATLESQSAQQAAEMRQANESIRESLDSQIQTFRKINEERMSQLQVSDKEVARLKGEVEAISVAYKQTCRDLESERIKFKEAFTAWNLERERLELAHVNNNTKIEEMNSLYRDAVMVNDRLVIFYFPILILIGRRSQII